MVMKVGMPQRFSIHALLTNPEYRFVTGLSYTCQLMLDQDL